MRAEVGALVNAVASSRRISTEGLAALEAACAKCATSTPAQARQSSERTVALERHGEPKESARTVVFYCSPANTHITSQTLLVDGGMYRGY